MSFNIALSGVSAAQKDLDVTANNIANVNTVGFKESRAEFGDVYAASLLSGGKTKVGDGVLTQEVAQQVRRVHRYRLHGPHGHFHQPHHLCTCYRTLYELHILLCWYQ